MGGLPQKGDGKLMFSPEQIRKYAEAIFPGQRLSSRPLQRLKCPIHDGRDRNFAFHLDRGVWTCHSRCGSGGMVQLEQRLHGGTREEATERLFKAIGMASQYASKQIVCTYDYVDAAGKLLSQKVRLDPKDFRWRTPVGDHGYTYGAPDPKRPLYGLPGVITSNITLITEGEKDADTLNAVRDWFAGAWGRVYATTPGAADSWMAHHVPFMAGKRVMVFEDNDEKGRMFRERVCAAVFPLAYSVRFVRFTELEEHGDVSDYLQQFGEVALLEKVKHAEAYVPPKPEERPATVIEGMQFAMSGNAETNWLMDGVIQQEGNGIIMGDPKASKSLTLVDLILSLISGTMWFGCAVPNRVRVGLVTREDAPGLTKKRIRRFIAGKHLANLDLENWLWVNSREQTATFDLMNDADFIPLVEDFKANRCQIVFFDVFNRIHRLDENDNTEMARITARLTQFSTEVGCQVGLVHHLNKDYANGKIFNRLRGAGALHGWMEWGMAITVVNPREESADKIVRRIEFESKEGITDPLYFRIVDGESTTCLERTNKPDEVASQFPVLQGGKKDQKTKASDGGNYHEQSLFVPGDPTA